MSTAVWVTPMGRRRSPPRLSPGLVGWLAGSLGFVASSDKIDSWTDPVTGFAVTGAGGTRPTDDELNGVRCPLFVSADSTVLSADIASLSAFTILAVTRYAAMDASQGLWRMGTSGDVVQAYAFHDSGDLQYVQAFGAPGRVTNQAMALATTRVIGHVIGSRVAQFINGVKSEVGGSAGLACAKLRLGDIGVAGYFHNGHVTDFLLWNRELSDAEMTVQSAYLGTLRGVY